ncbi:MAG: twin-arginine translocase subunit TatB [Alphaproteobacteria bacterium HGW-Alphaproteobacteria-4]|jgi:sec-independent protein translocase protein TatB|nr:MAG: twin-arginine translocase subunit TatB [Alphaproteobacteria bacterium HGW-Alphaproteobacteria-4]
MFDIGGSELLVIGIVALIVVGPKDLPGMFRTLGRFTAKARGMAREFSRAMEDAADATGMRETANDIKSLTSKKALGLDELEDAATAFEKWDPKLKGGYTPGPLPDPKPAAVAAPAAAKPKPQPVKAPARPARAGAPKPAPAASLTDPAPVKSAAAKPAPAKSASAKRAAAKPAPRPSAPRKPATKGDDA